MKDESKTKVDLIKNLKTMRKERDKSTANNIADRKQAKEKLQDSEEYLKKLFEYAPDAYYVNDLKGNFIDGNLAAERIIGLKREELIGKNILKLKLLSIKDMPKATKSIAKNIMGLATGPEEYVLNRKDKSTVEVEISNYPVKIKGKTFILGIARDITEHKQAEESLKKTVQVLNDTGEMAKVGGWEFDLLTQEVSWTGEVYRIHGVEPGNKIMLEEALNFYAPEYRSVLEEALNKTAETGEPYDLVSLLIPSGSKDKIWVRSQGKAVYQDGKIVKLVGTFQDIDKYKQAEEALQESDNIFKQFMKNSPNYVFFKNDKMQAIRLSSNYEKMLRKPIHELLGKTTDDLFPSDLAKSILADDLLILNEGKQITVEEELNGRFYSTIKFPILVEGKPRYLAGYTTDITERRQAETQLQQNYQKTKRAMDATIETMSKIVEAKDPYTAGHQQRVSQLSAAIAKELNLSQDKIEGIRIASLIHDIGKISLPTEILSKPSELSDIEFSLIKEHSQIGYDILKSIDFSYPVANIVLQHHERLNGSGYPNHLKGEDILLEAKIIGVADVVEAMSSHRPYRPALGIDKALEEISQNRGILYDPEVVDACLKLFKEKGFKFE
ncbi:MAG TPA: HD domain-containing phosphohydrolase [Atribacterota bacterium]|nr:HD domain-containing phosphohydrolase [Atribacterota bacterium]